MMCVERQMLRTIQRGVCTMSCPMDLLLIVFSLSTVTVCNPGAVLGGFHFQKPLLGWTLLRLKS